MNELYNGSLMDAYMQKQAAPQTTNEQINNNIAPTAGTFENMGSQADAMYNQWVKAYGAPAVNGLTGAGVGAAAGGLLGGGKGALGLGLLGGALGAAYGAIPGSTPEEKWNYVKQWIIKQIASGVSEEDIKAGMKTMAKTQAAQDAGADMGRDIANKKLDQFRKDHPTLYGIGRWMGRQVGLGRKDIVEAAGGVGRDVVRTAGEDKPAPGKQPAKTPTPQQPAAPAQPAVPRQKNVEVQEGQLASEYWNKQQPTQPPAPQQPKPAQPATQPATPPQQPA